MFSFNRHRRPRTPIVIQREEAECGVAALAIILAHHGCHVPLEELRLVMGVSRDGATALQIRDAARHYGLQLSMVSASLENISQQPTPCIIHSSFIHFIVLEGMDARRVYVNDPACGPYDLPREEFNDLFTGIVFRFIPGANFKKRPNSASYHRMLMQAFAPASRWIAGALLANLLATLSLIGLALWFSNPQPDISTAGLILAGYLMARLSREKLLSKAQDCLHHHHTQQLMHYAAQLPAGFYSYRFSSSIRISLQAGAALARDSAKLLPALLDSLSLLPLIPLLFVYSGLWGSMALGIIGLHLATITYLYARRYGPWRRLRHVGNASKGFTTNELHNIEAMKVGGLDSSSIATLTGLQAHSLSAEQAMGEQRAWAMAVPAISGIMVLGLLMLDGSGNIGRIQAEAHIGGDYRLIGLILLLSALLIPLKHILNKAHLAYNIMGHCRDIHDLGQQDLIPINTRSTANTHTLARGNLHIHQLRFGYSQHHPALLDQLDMRIEAGQSIAIHGATGAGKSTLARLLCGLESPWQGKINIGKSTITKTGAKTGTNIALLSGSLLYSASVRDNLSLWDDKYDNEALKTALDDACLGALIDSRGGLSCPVGHAGNNFSGGQQIRLNLARILLRQPAILIIDEAFDQLDLALEQALIARLKQRGITLILISQRHASLQACEVIYQLEQGRLQASTTQAAPAIPLPVESEMTETSPQSTVIAPTGIAHSVIQCPEPLFQVLNTLAAYVPTSRSTLQKPKIIPAGIDPVRAVAAASGLWLRRIRLTQHHWWQQDNGPLLAFTKGEQQPVVLLHENKGYQRQNNKTRINLATAQQLQTDAYMAYAQPQDTRTNLPRLLKQNRRSTWRDFSITSALQIVLLLVWLLACGITLQALQLGTQSVIPLAPTSALLLLLVGILSYTTAIARLRLEGLVTLSLHTQIWGRILQLPSGFFRQARTADILAWSKGLGPLASRYAFAKSKLMIQAIALLVALFIPLFMGLFMDKGLLLPFYSTGHISGNSIQANHTAMALIALASLSLARLMVYWLEQRQDTRVFKLAAQQQDRLEQWIKGIYSLRLLNAQQTLTTQWLQADQKQYRLKHRYRLWRQVLDVLYQALPYGVLLTILAHAEVMSAAQLIADGLLFVLVWQLTDNLIRTLGKRLRVHPFLKRMQPLLDHPLEVDPADQHSSKPAKTDIGPLSGAVSVKQLSYHYPNSPKSVLNKVSLEIKPGQIIALTGPSGSGKSTLLRLLLGFDQADSGEIYYDGHAIGHINIIAARRWMGVVLQNEWLTTATVRSHIAKMSPHGLEAVWDIAEQVGLADDIRRWPMGMQTLVDSAKLSTAQIRRIQIARALLSKPRILFLDEATQGLDTASEAQLLQVIRTRGIGCLVISHSPQTREMADVVVELT